MSCLAQILFVLSFLAPVIVSAQLRELEITLVQNNRVPVFRDHPAMAAVIINSSLTNLRFDSNLEIVATLGNAAQGEYILILNPVRQILTINASGYQQGRIILAMTEARQVVNYKIEPKAEVLTNIIPANFQITPNDAEVSINGNKVDHKKPISIEIGTHLIRIEKEGYRTIEREILISTDQNLFSESMVPIEPVLVKIRTQPPGASVYLGGVQVGLTEQNGDLGLFRFPGTYELSIQSNGYVLDSRTIEVTESGENVFLVTLVQNIGTLSLSVTPNDAIVMLNRQATDISQSLELAPGLYRIEVNKAWHEPFAETIEIQLGETITRRIVLVEHMGGIQILTSPFDAKWTISDSLGRSVVSGVGPRLQSGIPVQNYTLKVTSPGMMDYVEVIRIEKGKTSTFDIVLSKLEYGRLTISGNVSHAPGKLIRDGQIVREISGSDTLNGLLFGDYLIEYPRYLHYVPFKKKIHLAESAQTVIVKRRGWLRDSYMDLISLEGVFSQRTIYTRFNVGEFRIKYGSIRLFSINSIGEIGDYDTVIANNYDENQKLEIHDYLVTSLYVPLFKTEQIPVAVGMVLDAYPFRSLKIKNNSEYIEEDYFQLKTLHFNSANIGVSVDFNPGPIVFNIEGGYGINRRKSVEGISIPGGPFISIKLGVGALLSSSTLW